jgi:hypothetical protein
MRLGSRQNYRQAFVPMGNPAAIPSSIHAWLGFSPSK